MKVLINDKRQLLVPPHARRDRPNNVFEAVTRDGALCPSGTVAELPAAAVRHEVAIAAYHHEFRDARAYMRDLTWIETQLAEVANGTRVTIEFPGTRRRLIIPGGMPQPPSPSATPARAAVVGEPAHCPTTTGASVAILALPPWPIDLALLRAQKRWLADEGTGHPAAAGLLALLDAIQDHAVDAAGLPETEVFGYALADHDRWQAAASAAAAAFAAAPAEMAVTHVVVDAPREGAIRVLGACHASLEEAQVACGEAAGEGRAPVIVARPPGGAEYVICEAGLPVARIAAPARP